MNETQRTMAFVGVAAVSLLAAVFAAPKLIDPLADVNLGEEFFPEFKDATTAASLAVVVFNNETATVQRFGVENENGIWRIPSHNNYPADGEERLAKTAASLIGIKRDAFQSRSASSHESLGVIDPIDDTTSKLKGRGDRLTLKDKEGNTLVDFIIGKPVEGRNGFYYVRKADSDPTYIAQLEVDLSTKFADWVETDLLKLNRDDLNKIVINKYSIDEAARKIVGADKNELTRLKSADPWKLAGLKEKTEEVETANINSMISTMDDLKLIGVRPKPAGLSQELKISKDASPRTNEAFNDLISRGFFSTPDGLLSNEGEVIATTNKGVSYVLRFGEIFTGSGLEIEAGVVKDKQEAKPDDKGDDEKKDEKPGSDSTQGRYLFAFAQFDESALGPKPVEPKKPAPTAEKKPEEPAAEKKAGEKKTEENKAADADKKPADEKKADTPDPQKEYEQALGKYKSDLTAYEQKIEDGKKEVAELNRRFADWYYVISDESFKKLRLSRDKLAKLKEAAEPKTGAPAAGSPAIVAPPVVAPKNTTPKPSAPKVQEPKADEPKSPEAKKPEPKSDEAKDDKPEEVKAADDTSKGEDAQGEKTSDEGKKE